MAAKKKIKDFFKTVFVAAAVNQSLGAIALPIAAGTYYPKIAVSAEELRKYEKLPVYFEVLDYLNVSNSLVSKNWNRQADCKDYSLATYDTYLYLARANGRKDLLSKVRWVSGLTEDGGHMLLEYQAEYVDHGRFDSYETTSYTPHLEISEVEKYSERTRSLKINPLKKIWSRSFLGSRLGYPTLDGLMFPGGAARLFYEVFVER